MIEYYCDGSYKAEIGIVGCGIIRKGKRKNQKTFRFTIEEKWFGYHEIFAIYQTLLCIEARQEKEAIIFNDEIALMKAIQYHKKNHSFKIPKNLLAKTEPLFKKIEELKEGGYHILFQYKKEKYSKFMKKAHNWSRSYLKNEKIKQKIEERQKQRKIIMERKMLRNEVVEKGASEEINKTILLQSKQIYFKKISKKKWCILNEKEQPIYMNQNIVKMIYDVTNEVLEHKQTIEILTCSKPLFASALKTNSAKMQYPEIFKKVQQWEEENRIQFVS